MLRAIDQRRWLLIGDTGSPIDNPATIYLGRLGDEGGRRCHPLPLFGLDRDKSVVGPHVAICRFEGRCGASVMCFRLSLWSNRYAPRLKPSGTSVARSSSQAEHAALDVVHPPPIRDQTDLRNSGALCGLMNPEGRPVVWTREANCIRPRGSRSAQHDVLGSEFSEASGLRPAGVQGGEVAGDALLLFNLGHLTSPWAAGIACLFHLPESHLLSF